MRPDCIGGRSNASARFNPGSGETRGEDGGADVFVHIRSVVSPPGLRELKEAQRAEFDLGTDPRSGRNCAKGVRLI